MDTGIKFVIVAVGILVSIVILLIITPFTIVDTGERAVVLHWGEVDRMLDPGIHWITPISESVEKLDVTTKKSEVETAAASKDLQTVTSKVAVNYNIQPDKVDVIWTQFKGEQDEVVIAPSVQESVKAATAKYTAEELITKRELVKADILSSLKERLAESFIIVTNVSITNFDFSEQFNRSIESKVTAEQDALTSKNKLEQVKFEAEQRIQQARGEAEAIRIQAQAIQNQGGAEYVRLKTIEKWNGNLPTNLYGSAPIPFLNVNQ